jgi:hypothetical protein
VSSWYILSYCLVQIRKKGIEPVLAMISSALNRIFTALRSVVPEDMHDPVAAAVATLTRQTQAVRRSVLFKISHSEGRGDDEAMKAEMRALHALVSVFTQSPLPRALVQQTILTELNDIMLSVRLGFLFGPDNAAIASTFDDFRLAFAAHADRAGIAMQQIPADLRETEENKHEENEIDSRMDLMEMLDAGVEMITKMWGQSSRVTQLFGMLKQKAVDLEVVVRETMKQNVALTAKITAMRQENDRSTTLVELKKLYQDTHVFATGERPDEVPADELSLIWGIKEKTEVLDRQRTSLNENIAKAEASFPSISSQLEQDPGGVQVWLSEIVAELNIPSGLSMEETCGAVLAQIRMLKGKSGSAGNEPVGEIVKKGEAEIKVRNDQQTTGGDDVPKVLLGNRSSDKLVEGTVKLPQTVSNT